MSASDKSPTKRLRMVKTGGVEADSPETPRKQTRDDSTCPRCFGTGIEVVPGEGARRCDCKITDNRERLFRNARIPPRYQHCTLANSDAGTSEPMWIAKREAQIVLDDFLIIEG